MFEQEHLVIRYGKAYVDNKVAKDGHYHSLKGLEPEQEVMWSDEEALEHNMNKLLKGDNARYKDGGYSDEAAQARRDKNH